MKKLSLVLVLGLLCAENIKAQAPIDTLEGWSVSAGVGTGSAYDLLERNLAQDLSGFKTIQSRLGMEATLTYRAKRHWGMSIMWNQGGLNATNSSSLGTVGTKKYKERSSRYNTISLLFERRFAVTPESYIYWGIGFGAGFSNLEKVPTQATEDVVRSSEFLFLPQWKPLGICFGGKRVRAYLESGVGTLPWASGGLKVWLSR